MSEEAEAVGRRIRQIRKQMRTSNPRSRTPYPSQAELAAKLPGNVQGAEWSRWETGRHLPESDTLVEIAKLLGTTTADLRHGPPEERKPTDLPGANKAHAALSGSDGAASPDPAVLERKLDLLLDQLATVAADVQSLGTEVQAIQRRLQEPPDQRGAGAGS